MNTPSANLRDLFGSALALAPAARAGFLDAQCPEAGMRASVESRLRADASENEPVSSASIDHLVRAIGEASAVALPAHSTHDVFILVRGGCRHWISPKPGVGPPS